MFWKLIQKQFKAKINYKLGIIFAVDMQGKNIKIKEKNFMKTKRTAVVAFLLCAIMAIGIGFAAINKNLEINANANLGMDATGFSVAFVQSDCTVTGTDETSTIAVGTDTTVATFTVNGLKKAGDTVTGTFTVINNSSELYDAVLGTPSVAFGTGENPYRDYISVTTTGPQKTILAQNETTTFTVTVKLTKVINDASAQVTFMVLTSATSALPSA